jgi:hypothetical protein
MELVKVDDFTMGIHSNVRMESRDVRNHMAMRYDLC